MCSRLEKLIAGALRKVFAELTDGATIETSDAMRDTFSGLELFLPEVLREVHGEWEDESLDGIFPIVSRKTGPDEAELMGDCILISDQTLVPFHLRIQLDSERDKIRWLELRLGVRVDNRMHRIPYSIGLSPIGKLLSVADNVDSIDWFYAVAFGQRNRQCP